MHLPRHKEKEKWTTDYVERKTTRARKRVEDAEAVVQKEQNDTRNAENTGLTNVHHE
jgi:hypothetical protein